MAWRNGYIPESDLTIFRRGRNATDGDWFWGLTPATYARHLALVERAKNRTRRTLEPTDGWGTYRHYAAQVIARRIYGNGAAVPGTSSHGGYWEGRETLAIDYSNWSWVYGGDRATFYADCRAVGLTPGMIEPRRGYPDEPWHVIDENPRGPVPAFDNVSKFEPAPVVPPKRKKRTMIYAAWRDANNTIAVQAVAGGKVTLLKDPTEWVGIQAATGAEYAQVDNGQLQAILDRFGKLESPAFDTTTGAAAQVVVPLDGQNDRYQWAGDRLEWIDGDQLAKLQEQGARTQFLARDQIERLKA